MERVKSLTKNPDRITFVKVRLATAWGTTLEWRLLNGQLSIRHYCLQWAAAMSQQDRNHSRFLLSCLSPFPSPLQGDILDKAQLDSIFAEKEYFGVIHFAALKVRVHGSALKVSSPLSSVPHSTPCKPVPPPPLQAVGESVQKPLEYFEANTVGLLNVLNAMRKHGVKNFVFSSSATVYGSMEPPFYETTPVGVVSVEDWGQCQAGQGWAAAVGTAPCSHSSSNSQSSFSSSSSSSFSSLSVSAGHHQPLWQEQVHGRGHP